MRQAKDDSTSASRDPGSRLLLRDRLSIDRILFRAPFAKDSQPESGVFDDQVVLNQPASTIVRMYNYRSPRERGLGLQLFS
jgi:hypothetical protein